MKEGGRGGRKGGEEGKREGVRSQYHSTHYSRFLNEVQANSEVNKMPSLNLATMFGPNLLRPQVTHPIHPPLHSLLSPLLFLPLLLHPFFSLSSPSMTYEGCFSIVTFSAAHTHTHTHTHTDKQSAGPNGV